MVSSTPTEYYIKFDTNGKRIASIPTILIDDYGGEAKLKLEGYILVSDEDYQYYVGNKGAGKNKTGYIYDFKTKKPVDAPPQPPQPPQPYVVDPNTIVAMTAIAQINERIAKLENGVKK